MTVSRTCGVCFVVLSLVAAACGGSTPPAASTLGAPSAKPPTSASAAPAPATSSTAAPGPQTGSTLFDVDMAPTRISPQPKVLPKVSIDVPGSDQFLPSSFLAKKDYKVRPNIRGWEGLGDGAYLQLILDNVPAEPITNPKASIKLQDLAPGGNLADGEHVLAAFMCRPNHESFKGPDGIGVSRFWAVKNAGKEYKSTAPMLILNRPYGTYKGTEADDILIDWYLLNAVMGEKDNYVHITLKGPGIKEEGLSRNVTDWVPYSIISPHSGEYTIQAELMDKNGNLIPGVWNSTTRKFKVEK